MAVPHYTYLVLKMSGPNGIITVKGSFELSDLCDKEFHKMAQIFGMMANYGEPKDKAKKCDYRSRTTTRRTFNKARSEETAGAAVRSRRSSRRQGKNFGNIGGKVHKSRVEK
jgi:hypothetical protein